jgi:hypothetical protein
MDPCSHVFIKYAVLGWLHVRIRHPLQLCTTKNKRVKHFIPNISASIRASLGSETKCRRVIPKIATNLSITFIVQVQGNRPGQLNDN